MSETFGRRAVPPLDADLSDKGRRWFAEAREKSAREEAEVEAFKRRRDGSDSAGGGDGWFSSDGDGDGGSGD